MPKQITTDEILEAMVRAGHTPSVRFRGLTYATPPSSRKQVWYAQLNIGENEWEEARTPRAALAKLWRRYR
jgi:hypothetical protein